MRLQGRDEVARGLWPHRANGSALLNVWRAHEHQMVVASLSPHALIPWCLSRFSRPGPLLPGGSLSVWLILWDLLHCVLGCGLLGQTVKGVLEALCP